MAAAVIQFRFLTQSGRIVCVNGYASDAAAVAVKFDESKVAVAGSPDIWTAKENCWLIDVCAISDLATPTSLQLLVNGTPTGDILDVTGHLASVVARPNPKLPLSAGAKFGATQIT